MAKSMFQMTDAERAAFREQEKQRIIRKIEEAKGKLDRPGHT